VKCADRFPAPSHFEQCEAFGTENTSVPTALAKDFFEFSQSRLPFALPTVGMAEVRTRSDPSTRVAVDVGGDGEGAAEDGDGFGEVVEVVEDDA